MRYLVTGATGFVGRYLCEHLQRDGHKVFAMVRRGGTAPVGTTEVVADLWDEAATEHAVGTITPDGIFHLAAAETWPRRSKETPAETIRGNVLTIVSILEAARRTGKVEANPTVKIQSTAGNSTRTTAHLNTAVPPPKTPRVLFVSSIVLETRPDSPYAVSKKLGEEICRMYGEDYGVPVIVVRPSNHTGPGQPDIFAVPNFVRQIVEMEQGQQRWFLVGDLSAYKDFTDVRDMVAAYAVVMARGEPGTRYVAASGRYVQMRDILQYLATQSTATIDPVPDLAGEAGLAAEPALKSDSNATVKQPELPSLDTTAINALGWQPRIDIEQTWRDMLEDARAHLTKRST